MQKGRRLHTHTYQRDNGRKAPEWAFLDEGPAPQRLGKEVPTTMALVAAVAAKVAGTYKIPKRWVNFIDTDTMLVPLLVVRSY
jgi:hypothetical protein